MLQTWIVTSEMFSCLTQEEFPWVTIALLTAILPREHFLFMRELTLNLGLDVEIMQEESGTADIYLTKQISSS